MIYIPQSDIAESDFVNLLYDTKHAALDELRSDHGSHSTDGLVFEDLVHRNACKAARNTFFEDNIIRTSSGAFPDIVARKFYGVEVKATSSDKWVSIGNSILESSRMVGVERIYMFFGKLGGQVDIKYRPYQECLSDIGVTHSPRYKIDMALPAGSSIFDKIGVEYDTLRKDVNPIKVVKNYYRSQLKEGEELWWIGQQEEVPTSPIIKTFKSLSKEDRDTFLAEAMLFFPEIFGRNQDKFERVAAYLVASRNTVSSNLRDKFTASGRVKLRIKDREITVPRIFGKLYIQAVLIKKLTDKITPSEMAYYWRVEESTNSIVDLWLKRLNEYSDSQLREVGVLAQDIFEQGLQDAKEKVHQLPREEL